MSKWFKTYDTVMRDLAENARQAVTILHFLLYAILYNSMKCKIDNEYLSSLAH